jgi:hypothetical protein
MRLVYLFLISILFSSAAIAADITLQGALETIDIAAMQIPAVPWLFLPALLSIVSLHRSH